MPQIQPPSAVPPVVATTPSAGVTPVEATVTSVPDKITQLLRQLQVSGTIATPPTGDSVTLSTALGQLTIALPELAQDEKQKLLQTLLTMFQNQRVLTVVVQPGDPPTQAFLLLPSLPANAAAQPVTGTPTLAQIIPQVPQPLAPGQQLSAIVLPPETLIALPATTTPATAATLANLPALPAHIIEYEANLTSLASQAQLAEQNPASAPPSVLQPPVPQSTTPVPTPQISLPGIPLPQLSAQLAQPQITPNIPINVPTAPEIISSSLIQIQNVAQQPNTPTTQTAVATVPVAALLQPGKEVVITINAVTPSNVPPSVATASNQIVATVVGNGPNGQLVLKTGDAVLYVRQNVAAPVGSGILLTVDVAKPALVTQSDAPGFSGLQQALAALTQSDPQAALQFLQNAIPQPNERLPGMLLLFLNAFKRGDTSGWPGSAASDILMRAGKMEFLAKLAGDISHAGLSAHDAKIGEWRSFPIPLYADGKFNVLDFYVHNDKHGGGNADQKSGAGRVRFLIDMRMSRLGAIQLDGLVQPKKLDMIVRSERTLPAQLPNDLRDGFIKTLGALGYTGGLSFQIGWQHWLAIKKDSKTSVTT